jgi:hypothetical protein
MTNREIATDELMYSMDVGSVIEVRDGLITRNRFSLRPTRLLPRLSGLRLSRSTLVSSSLPHEETKDVVPG